MSLAIAVDGGNSKTDLVLVTDEGAVLALAHGPASSPHHLGVEPALDVLGALLDEAAAEAGLQRGSEPLAEVAELLLAGVDFPDEETIFQERAAARGWARRTHASNDTFAVLRAGTERGWGVAVVCGAGINCVGVGPDGRHARFPALGPITGDWGGGYDLGVAAVSAAARSEDGRGPRTSLERSVPAHFGLDSPIQLAHEIHLGRIALRRVVELAPIVLAEADDDPVAAELVARLASEIVALARVAITRLQLEREAVEVLLGGGLFRSPVQRLVTAIQAGLAEVGPAIAVRPAASPPILGAALLGLDQLGAGAEAQARLRRELTERAAETVTVGGGSDG